MSQGTLASRISTRANAIKRTDSPRFTWAGGIQSQPRTNGLGAAGFLFMLTITPELLARFWSKVIRKGDNECWLWTASITSAGYGKFWLGPLTDAHRVCWILTHGEIPEGKHVLHKCDVRRCVNLNHLFLGTAKTNIEDCIRKGRFNRPKGTAHFKHKLTEDDVRLIRRSTQPATHLSERFGVTASNISAIRRREFWKHVK